MTVQITYKSLQKVLSEALISDKVKILAAARRVFGTKQHPVLDVDVSKAEKLALDAALAIEKAQKRAQTIPEISYPEELPVSREHEALAKALQENQVLIVAGDTGSGKTTQLPKICLEAGFGRRGMIGHTQTRRLATRTVAARISEELKVELGTAVGYKIRFGDKTADNTIIKLMTDGVLLTELENDRYLNDYEVLIIDEAHERSLNIDFILGFLRDLLQKRKDLKVIVTSATIDLERFSKHFNNAPIMIVEGRTYPVEVRYEPIGEYSNSEDEDIDEEDLLSSILRAVDELCAEPLGDILIFLNGERDIAETADYLRRANIKNTEILPLYARLSNAEQNKVFAPHSGRRIVLATNVAETSITVPGIRYVIDPGTARISRYSPRTKVQRLPIEPISQASANQRKGRCGRVADGICIRLYSELDFLGRPEFTDPEILRTNLAAVILRMINLRIGDITSFPFIEPPEQKQVNDGIKLLEELHAVIRNENNEIKLTRIGSLMAKLPCDPRLARMLVEANDLHALAEVLVITANLSAQETRERPLNKREAANQMHSRFNDEQSDFISMLKLHEYLVKITAENSNSSLRKVMRKEFLSYLRMREWFDIYSQLKEAVVGLKFKINEEKATYEQLHRSLLCGLLGQLGFKKQDGFEYVGARNNHFYIFPGSGLAKKAPKWIMAAEITETSKLYARNVAAIEPEWTEKVAGDLIRYSYSDEHWSKNSGAVIALQKGVLYGLPVINGRKVNYTKINPPLCRELFIREGLVNGEFITKDKFFKHNLDLVQELEDLEDKSRRRDLLVNDDTLVAFYDERIPDDIGDARSFETWWSVKYKENPNYLNFDIEMLAQKDPESVSQNMYPDHLTVGRFKLNLSYNFDPTAENDGVTVTIPVSILNQIDGEIFLWLIPGLRQELFTSLIRVLPKAPRRNFVPAPNYGQVLNESLSPEQGYFWDVLCQKMTKLSGLKIEKKDFDLTALPKHLSFYFKVIDIKKKVLLEGRELEYIRHKLKDEVKNSLEQVVKEMPKQEGITSWNFDNIPKTRTRILGGMEIIAYPALRDAGNSVSLELFESEEEAQRQMWKGQKRLIMLAIPSPLSFLENKLPNKAKLAMYFNVVGDVKSLISDLESLALDEMLTELGGVAWDKPSFEKLVEQVKGSIYDKVLEISKICEGILVKANDVRKKLKGKMDFSTAYAFSDMGAQLSHLIYKGFATDATPEYFPHLERYLDAMLRRIEKVPQDPNRDLMMLNKLKSCEDNYESLLGLFAGKIVPYDVKMVKFMLEELRVSYFAQSFKTLYPVSDKRVNVEIERLRVFYRK
jgi:ATP-dependent helicase HrpA